MNCYDSYNHIDRGEVTFTLRGDGSGDACPKVAYGFSHSNSNTSMETKPKEECAMSLRSVPTGEGATIQSLGFKPTVAITTLLAAMRYIVRRLTPKEAERLMGLPDGYTIPMGLRRYAHSIDGQTVFDPAVVAEFQRIFDTFNAIMFDYAHAKWERSGRKGKEPKPPKPKSAKQVADWLKKISDPATCPDSPRYKGDGNGMATNQLRWILTRLLVIGEGIDPFEN